MICKRYLCVFNACLPGARRSKLIPLFTLIALLLTSCIRLPDTGNGEPYAGVTDPEKKDPDDPDTAAFKTYEAKLYSPKYKVLVSYHDVGLHKVNVFNFNQSKNSYELIKTSITEKKKISGDRVYESQDLQLHITEDSAILKQKGAGASGETFQLKSLTYDCSSKLNNSPFAGGEGTQANPYKICTAKQLNNIRGNFLGSYFVLWSDLNLSEFSKDPLKSGWNPIGDSNLPFSGNFDGNLFKIQGLKIQPSTDKTTIVSRAGLFGVVTNGGVLSNVNLVDVSISGEFNLGALAGEVAYAKIINIQTSGDIYARLNSAGGIVGAVMNYTNNPCEYSVSRTTSAVNLWTSSLAGGIVGKVHSDTCSGSITDSSSSGTIEAAAAGGLVGGAYSTNIARSWSTSNIKGVSTIGGLVGYAHSGSIQDSYHTGDLTVENSAVGGIIGLAFTGTEINRVYTASNVSGRNDLGGFVGKAQNSPSIKNSFFSGRVDLIDGAGPNVGSIVGFEEILNHVQLENIFWHLINGFGNLSCIGNRSSDRCGSGIAEEVREASTFYDSSAAPLNLWNFETVWRHRPGALPELKRVD